MALLKLHFSFGQAATKGHEQFHVQCLLFGNDWHIREAAPVDPKGTPLPDATN
jgi:hypothetical protein